MILETRILLIDDSAERVIFLKRILNECGYESVTSCTPTDIILDHVSRFNPEVILIDVFSPSRDTLEQLTTIRDVNPRPVVLLSQDDNMQTIEAAFKCGVTAYVSREVTRSQAKPIIDIEEDEFIVLATDGIFQAFENEEVIKIVRDQIGPVGNVSPFKMARKLTDMALEKIRGNDNMTDVRGTTMIIKSPSSAMKIIS